MLVGYIRSITKVYEEEEEEELMMMKELTRSMCSPIGRMMQLLHRRFSQTQGLTLRMRE